MIHFYHHFASLPCVKVRLLLEELQLPYEATFIDLSGGAHKTPEFLHQNPFGKVPSIDWDGFRLAESGAIVRYLVERCQRYDLYPKNLEERARVDEWTDYLTQHVCEPLSDLIWYIAWAAHYGYPVDDKAVLRARDQLNRELPLCEAHLQTRRYFSGPAPTLADFSALAHFGNAYRAGLTFEAYPSVKRWAQSMTSRPSWQKVHVPGFSK